MLLLLLPSHLIQQVTLLSLPVDVLDQGWAAPGLEETPEPGHQSCVGLPAALQARSFPSLLWTRTPDGVSSAFSLTCDSPSSLHAVDLRCPLALLPGAAPPAVARRDPAPPTACTPRVWRASSGSAVPDPDLLRSAVRRSWLPACLLSCLRGGDRG